MRKQGIFITLEGPEGAGKSTQGRRLTGWLRRRGMRVLFTREPGGTRVGQKLRRILLDHRSGKLDPLVELCLYEASRKILMDQVIRPALRSGRIVILDRFQDSTWVYQGWAGGCGLKLVEELGRAVMGDLAPDRTIVLDLPVKKGLARVRHPNRMEAKPLAFHEKVRQGYLTLARRQPQRIRVVRADQPPAKVQQEIRKAIQDVLEKYRRK
ncbi:MAG: dTMP kinase [Candidatus Omnitrophica bacterium]|nr:dTMP kinase [Candidatus Omnitrophota bacterium]